MIDGMISQNTAIILQTPLIVTARTLCEGSFSSSNASWHCLEIEDSCSGRLIEISINGNASTNTATACFLTIIAIKLRPECSLVDTGVVGYFQGAPQYWLVQFLKHHINLVASMSAVHKQAWDTSSSFLLA